MDGGLHPDGTGAVVALRRRGRRGAAGSLVALDLEGAVRRAHVRVGDGGDTRVDHVRGRGRLEDRLLALEVDLLLAILLGVIGNDELGLGELDTRGLAREVLGKEPCAGEGLDRLVRRVDALVGPVVLLLGG